ncbi:hypothetical protein [Yersinia sp. 2466 StPb PI]
MIDLTAEQQQLAKIVHDYASQFPPTENDFDVSFIHASPTTY